MTQEQLQKDLAVKPLGSLTTADIENMSSDVYRSRMRDPEFVKFVNEKEAARPPRLR